MYRSAIRSRWAVETPGLSSDSTSARTSATIRPARRILSISPRDFRVTTSAPLPGREQPAQQIVGDLLDGPGTVDRFQHARAAVVIYDIVERRHLPGEARAARVGSIARPRVELRAVHVADARHARRIQRFVVGMAAGAADPPARQPAEQHVLGDLDVRSTVDADAAFREGSGGGG